MATCADPGALLGQPLEILRRVFGFPDFRGLQEQAIRHVIEGGDGLVLMPTGGGKSLCYQVPALCRPGTALVVSPLIALMDDQVAALRQFGIAAGALHSELAPMEQREVGRALDEGRLDLLYISPERLLSPGTHERLQRQRIALIAIDEAHCVSQWGHEFRPEYRSLAGLSRSFPGVPRLALTATADPRTRDDILIALDMPEARVFAASFHRPNLGIGAAPKQGETRQLLQLLERHRDEAGIVYCGSRARTERLAAWIAARGIPALAFHAGLPAETKRAALARFRSGEKLIMVATIAFGMGIDRPDVRFVVHLDMPDSPEAYYQQIGRAGRDGEAAETLLLHGAEDIVRARHFLQMSAAPAQQKQVMRSRLEAMIGLAETVHCRTRALLACFGEDLGGDCGHCDNCRARPTSVDGTRDAQKLLSAIYRTGQRFGALHVIAVLRGEATDAVRHRQHDRLPVFGLGAESSVEHWRSVLRQLIALGAIDMQIDERFATLVLVPDRARPILRGEETVHLRMPATKTPRPSTPLSATASGPPLTPEEQALFEKLRLWRAREAKAQGVPPYVIFHDSTLRDIAHLRPSTLAALGEIRGVGASKRGRYGEAVLSALG